MLVFILRRNLLPETSNSTFRLEEVSSRVFCFLLLHKSVPKNLLDILGVTCHHNKYYNVKTNFRSRFSVMTPSPCMLSSSVNTYYLFLRFTSVNLEVLFLKNKFIIIYHCTLSFYTLSLYNITILSQQVTGSANLWYIHQNLLVILSSSNEKIPVTGLRLEKAE